MKTRHTVSTLLATALIAAAAAVNTHAQTWQTILPNPDYALPSQGRSLLVDPTVAAGAPLRLLVGTVDYSGSPTVLRVTPNDPASPDGVVALEGVDAALPWVPRLAYIPGEGFYAAGRFTVTIPTKGKKTTTSYFWKVRRSVNGEAGTWLDEDTFIYDANCTGSMAHGIATDGQSIYVSGWAAGSLDRRWIVRSKRLGTRTWTKVLAWPGSVYVEPTVCSFTGNTLNRTPAILTAGRVQSGRLGQKWTVLRSQDRGTSWQTVDTWSPASGTTEAIPVEITCDPVSGAIYALGGMGNAGDVVPSGGWVVRVNRCGGDAGKWQTLIEDYGQRGAASQAAFDSMGNLAIVGSVAPNGTSPALTVIRYCPGQDWADSWAQRMFPFEGFSSSGSRTAITADASGILYVTDQVTDWMNDGYSYPGTRLALTRLVFP